MMGMAMEEQGEEDEAAEEGRRVGGGIDGGRFSDDPGADVGARARAEIEGIEVEKAKVVATGSREVEKGRVVATGNQEVEKARVESTEGEEEEKEVARGV